MKSEIKYHEMKIIGIYHISNNTTYLLCRTNWDYSFDYPCTGRIYIDDTYLTNITIEGFVLDNSKPSENGVNQLTLWIHNHLDKTLFDFSRQMTLRIDE